MGHELGAKRRGRWITEEEDFARACIDAFTAGMLSDVEEGTTLRAFLAKQLECQPMRVTKKLHGSRGMGKRLFHRAGSATQVSMDTVRLELGILEARMNAKIRAKSDKMSTSIHFGTAARQQQAVSPSSPDPLGMQAPAAVANATAPMSLKMAPTTSNGATEGRASANKGTQAQMVSPAQHDRHQGTSTGATEPKASYPAVAAAAAGLRRGRPRANYTGVAAAVATAEAIGGHLVGEGSSPTAAGRSAYCRRRIYNTEKLHIFPPQRYVRQRRQHKRPQRSAAAAPVGRGEGGNVRVLKPVPTCPFPSFPFNTSSGSNGGDGGVDEDALKNGAIEFGGISTADFALPAPSGDGIDGALSIGTADNDGGNFISVFGGSGLGGYSDDSGWLPLRSNVEGKTESCLGANVLRSMPTPYPVPLRVAGTLPLKPSRGEHRTNNGNCRGGHLSSSQATLNDSMTEAPRQDHRTIGQHQNSDGDGCSRRCGGVHDGRSGRGNAGLFRGVDLVVPSFLGNATNVQRPQRESGPATPSVRDNDAVVRCMNDGSGGIVPGRSAPVSGWVGLTGGVRDLGESGDDDDDDRDEDDGSEPMVPVIATAAAAAAALETGTVEVHNMTWELKDMDMDSDWEKLQLASSTMVQPIEWLAAATTEAATVSAATVTLEDATMDDWITDADFTSAKQQNHENPTLPCMSKGMAAWWET